MLDHTEINMLLIASGGVVLAFFFGVRNGIRAYRKDAKRWKAIMVGLGTGIAWLIGTGWAITAYGFSSG